MAKKPIDPHPEALAALTRALADPTPLVLLGSAKQPGFFKGATLLTKAAAQLCEQRGWVVGSNEWVGTGKSKKQKYRLSPAGVQAVLERDETALLVRGLATALQQQTEHMAALRQQFEALHAHRQPLADAVAQLLKKVQPPDVEAILRKLNGSPTVAADWLEDVVKMTAEQGQRDRLQPLTLPAVFAALRPSRPTLTLGQFHDGLRLLRDQGSVRLTPFTRALATIDDARNALFLDGEVMYYVQLP